MTHASDLLMSMKAEVTGDRLTVSDENKVWNENLMKVSVQIK